MTPALSDNTADDELNADVLPAVGWVRSPTIDLLGYARIGLPLKSCSASNFRAFSGPELSFRPSPSHLHCDFYGRLDSSDLSRTT